MNVMWKTLWIRLMEQTKLPDVVLAPDSKLINKCFKEATIKEIIDIANFCWMLWERLGKKE